MRAPCKYAEKMIYNRFVNGELKGISVNECFAVLEPFECTDQCREKCGKYKPLSCNTKLSWVPTDKFDKHYYNVYKCARCGKEIIERHNYCPYCGYEYNPWDGTILGKK